MIVVVNNSCRPDRPLSTLVAARNASLEFVVKGVPQGMESVTVHLGRGDSESRSTVAAMPLPSGGWRVYASPLYFPAVGEAEWHLVGRNGHGHAAYMGKGRLKIIESVSDKGDELPPLIPDDTYLRNPVTGLWHRLTATIENGLIVPNIEKKGIAR